MALMIGDKVIVGNSDGKIVGTVKAEDSTTLTLEKSFLVNTPNFDREGNMSIESITPIHGDALFYKSHIGYVLQFTRQLPAHPDEA